MPHSFDLRPYMDRLKAIQGNFVDVETAHEDADQVLCDLLKALGYNKVVEEYNKVEKWYT